MVYVVLLFINHMFYYFFKGELPEVPPSKLPQEEDQEIQLPEVPTHQLGLEEGTCIEG